MSNLEQEWKHYLRTLSSRSADEVRMMWNSIVCEVPNIRVPVAGPSEDYKTFAFQWSDDVNHLEVEFTLGLHQEIEWFYVNGLTYELDGSPEPSSYLTKELLNMLSLWAVEPQDS